MKVSLARGPSGTISTQNAWGCLTSNLAIPGSGSLLAGRASGYGQLLLALIGMVLSLVFGARFVVWQISNWSRLFESSVDPFGLLQEVWIHVRWAALGLGIFLLSIIWALASSLSILDASRKAERLDKLPPRLNGGQRVS